MMMDQRFLTPRNQGGTPVPLQLSTLYGWYDAADIATITHTGGAVSQWNDKGPYKNHLSQSVESEKPTTGVITLNGLNVIEGDGVDDGLSNLTLSGIPSTDMIVLAVIRVDTVSSSNNYHYRFREDSTSKRWGVRSSNTGNGRVRVATQNMTNPNNVISVADFKGTTHIQTTIYNFTAGSLELRVNGGVDGDISTELSGGPATVDELELTTGTGALDGYWAEIVVAGIDENVELIEGHLAHKWGLAGLLPMGHTYKNEAPPT